MSDELKKMHNKMIIASNLLLRDLFSGSMTSKERIGDLEIEMGNVQENIRQMIDKPSLPRKEVVVSRIPASASLIKL